METTRSFRGPGHWRAPVGLRTQSQRNSRLKCGDSWLLWLTGLEHAEGGVGDGRAEWTSYHCVDAIELPSVQLNQAVSLAKALVRGEPTAGAFRMMDPDTVL